VDDTEWRRWNNVHRAVRAGVSFKEMTEAQRSRAFALVGAGLSARGLEQTRNIMRLNETIAEIVGNFDEYGEWLYHITVMGDPSPTAPWGWQLEGHHLIINYFVLGDQVVMTPTFMGSEPVFAEAGKYAGTRVLQDEQEKGLALMRALSPDQQRAATIEPGTKTVNKAQGQAYRDNLQLPYAGIRHPSSMAASGSCSRRDRRIRGTHAGWPREGAHGRGRAAPRRHALRLDRREQPRQRLLLPHPQPGDPDRVRPPDADCMKGPKVPTRQHIHTVVRTRTATTTARICSGSTTSATSTTWRTGISGGGEGKGQRAKGKGPPPFFHTLRGGRRARITVQRRSCSSRRVVYT
jgi:hypothetical protein